MSTPVDWVAEHRRLVRVIVVVAALDVLAVVLLFAHRSLDATGLLVAGLVLVYLGAALVLGAAWRVARLSRRRQGAEEVMDGGGGS